jgi:hypothetical protein
MRPRPLEGVMGKIEAYKDILQSLEDVESYLLKESGLPGPRGNIELAKALAEVGDESLFQKLLKYTPDIAPVNTPQEYLAFCGTIGMGKILLLGDMRAFNILRAQASDPRWRTREGVAMALQMYGLKHMDLLLKEMESWARGNMLEQRAAAAALCEPALLGDKAQVAKVQAILDEITTSVIIQKDRKSEDFKALKKGLSYCWSVAVAANPDEGKKLMEKWFSSEDKDIKSIMKENLKKNRLERKDPAWVEKWKIKMSV